jgi:hypothetical protein
MTRRDEWSLGTLESQPADLWPFDPGDRISWSILKVELERLAEVRQGIVLTLTKTRHVNVEALSHVVLAFAEDNGLYIDRLHDSQDTPELKRIAKPRPFAR